MNCITVQWSDQARFTCSLDACNAAKTLWALLAVWLDIRLCFGKRLPPHAAHSLAPRCLRPGRNDVSRVVNWWSLASFSVDFMLFFSPFPSLASHNEHTASLELGLRYSNPFLVFKLCATDEKWRNVDVDQLDTFFKYHSTFKINFNVTSSINQYKFKYFSLIPHVSNRSRWETLFWPENDKCSQFACCSWCV